MRIHVTGNAASGKTSLAEALGSELGLLVFSLDSVVWQPGWTKTPREQRLAAERRLVASPSWIIEGVSAFVRSHADIVLFLDVPRHVCAWRGLMRSVRYFNRTRPGLPHPCPDIQIVPRLLNLIYRFPERAGADIRREAAAEPHRYCIERHPIGFERIVRRVTGA